ncbi:hypothetical protein BH11PAT4_BH11PAT4_7600 [soil metagenome]
MQQAKGDLLVPVITSLLVGALVSGGLVYALTGMNETEDAPVTVATATPTATPTTTATPTATPTATTATTKEFSHGGKVLFSYPAEYTVIQSVAKYSGGGGTILTAQLGATNATTGLIERLPITISSLQHGAPAEAPSLESLLPDSSEDKKTLTNSKGAKVMTAKDSDLGGYNYYGVITGQNSGYKVMYGTALGNPVSATYSEAQLKALFDKIVDTISL